MHQPHSDSGAFRSPSSPLFFTGVASSTSLSCCSRDGSCSNRSRFVFLTSCRTCLRVSGEGVAIWLSVIFASCRNDCSKSLVLCRFTTANAQNLSCRYGCHQVPNTSVLESGGRWHCGTVCRARPPVCPSDRSRCPRPSCANTISADALNSSV